MKENGGDQKHLSRKSGAAVHAVLLLLIFGLFAAGCKSGGDEFRRALRSAAHAPSGGPKKQTANKKENPAAPQDAGVSESAEARLARKNSIKGCPEGARLMGAAYPKQLAQWCAATSKDGKEVRHGEYRRWHKNGKLKTKASYKYGKYDGRIETYYPSGEIRELTSYAEGVRHGEFAQWNKDGTAKQRGSFQNGQKHGAFTWWSRDGKVQERGGYQNDEKSGEWVTYHRNGQIRSITGWQRGLKHGKDEQYSREGVLLSKGGFAENLPAGTWTLYFKNGQKREEGVYIAGQKHGQWAEYRPDGGIKKITAFNRGVVVGTQEAKGGGTAKRGRKRTARFGKGDILGAAPPVRQNRRAARPAIPEPSETDEPKDWEELPTNESAGWKKL